MKISVMRMSTAIRATSSLALMASALSLAACTSPVPPRPQPAFYVDLSRPGAMLDPVTASEIINAYRAKSGLPPLVWDSVLEREAQEEAAQLADRGDLADGGRNPLRRGLRRSVSGGYHSFADAFSGWRGSPAHDGVLRAADGGRYAIAALARTGSRHRVYWVMLVSKN
jgi:uncharacterized protein YkwD